MTNAWRMKFIGQTDLEASLALLEAKPISLWFERDLEVYDALRGTLESSYGATP